MKTETKISNEHSSGGTPQELNPTPASLLLEQYKLLEERRKYFGNQFMQTIGGVYAVVGIVLGILAGKSNSDALVRLVLVNGGVAFILIAYLSYRLGKRQNDCEEEMKNIEESLRSMSYSKIARAPRGASGFGARIAIIGFLLLSGLSLIMTGYSKW